MYVTISAGNTVSIRGRHVGHAGTHHRSAQPVRKAWRGKSCCCNVNKPVVRGRRAVVRTSRAVVAAMLASVDNHRVPGVRRQRGIPPASNGGERADKGSRTSFAIVAECGVRECLSRETGLGGDVFGRI